MKPHTSWVASVAGLLLGTVAILPLPLFAHCDTMNGPVIVTARKALEQKDVTPVLKWVEKDAEAQIKEAFNLTLAVRANGAQARQLADQFFFETLVRIHRAGEGAPFTGLKPAGTPIEPSIAEADKALETGSVEDVLKAVTNDITAGIRKRFSEVQEKKRHAEENVDAGRQFVAAYVEYVHYIEGLQQAAETDASHHESADSSASGEPAHNLSGGLHQH